MKRSLMTQNLERSLIIGTESIYTENGQRHRTHMLIIACYRNCMSCLVSICLCSCDSAWFVIPKNSDKLKLFLDGTVQCN